MHVSKQQDQTPDFFMQEESRSWRKMLELVLHQVTNRIPTVMIILMDTLMGMAMVTIMDMPCQFGIQLLKRIPDQMT